MKPYNISWPNAKYVEYKGNIVGYTISNPSVSLHEYLVLTMNRKLLSPGESKQLAREANLDSKKVVLVPNLNMLREPEFIPTKEQYGILAIVAYHSQDDVTTAVLAGRGQIESTVDYSYAAIAYTYNQIVAGRVEHAEAVLAEFLKVIAIEETKLWWLMLLEPCYNCLIDMTLSNSEVISYFNSHKEKWNTPEYLELKQTLQASGKTNKIIYVKEIIT